jgi:hypothetical protein
MPNGMNKGPRDKSLSSAECYQRVEVCVLRPGQSWLLDMTHHCGVNKVDPTKSRLFVVCSTTLYQQLKLYSVEWCLIDELERMWKEAIVA